MDPVFSMECRIFLFVTQHLSRVRTADHTGLVKKAHSTPTTILQLMEMSRMDLLNRSTLSLLPRRAKPAQEMAEAQCQDPAKPHGMMDLPRLK
jgi:hypothetical protein